MKSEAQYDDEYATCVETHAWLRVMGEMLDPHTVTSRLKVQPTKTQLRGALPREGSSHPYKYSGWFLESKGHVQSRDSRRHLDWLLDSLQGRQVVLRDLKDEGNLVDICIRWDSVGQGGPTLNPKQMTLLGALGVELWFDIYFAGEDGDA